MTPAIDERVVHREAIANGVRLHSVEAGPVEGPLVVLLHGFPECWYTWRRQIPALADAGHRVVAPDMRGYNRSEKPRGVAAYRLDRLAGDVAGLIDALGADSASVVGHDWGGVVAWATAMDRPDAIDRLAVLNAPHPIAFVRESSAEQALRSWYGLLFQLPWAPEALLRAGEYRALTETFREGPERPDAFDDEDVRRFVRALDRPGALTAALNYYRAFFRGTVRENALGAIPLLGSRPADLASRIDLPTLVLWGERDPALSVEQTEYLAPYVRDPRIEQFPDASHWVHADRPERVNGALRAFLDGAGTDRNE